MANIKYLKGVRTRYINILNKDSDEAAIILEGDISSSDKSETLSKVHLLLERLYTYGTKLETQSEKVTAKLGDDDSLTTQILDEDSKILDSIFTISSRLKNVEAQLQRAITEEEFDVKSEKNQNAGVTTEIQQVLEMQMKIQKDILESQNAGPKQTSNVKLPKLEIPFFNGDKLRWVEFWQSFDSSVNKNDSLSNIEKFNYLRSKLSGDAKKAVAGLALSSENYTVAIAILKERFGNIQETIDLHYNGIINVYSASDRVESLRRLLDNVDRHLRSLEVLGQDVNQDVFVSVVKSKLPGAVIRHLEIQKGSKEKWTVAKLRHLLNEYIVASERAEESQTEGGKQREKNQNSSPNASKGNGQEKYADRSRHWNSDRSLHKNHPRSSTEALSSNAKTHVSNNKQCRYCSKDHWSDECPKFRTISERKKCLKGSCFQCLKEGHMSNECKSKKVCVYCKEANVHHRSLCPRKFKQRNTTESVHVTDEQEVLDCDTEVVQENALLSSGEVVLMQTSTTKVMNQKRNMNQSVRLLLDSGSQRTYITEKLAERLQLKKEKDQEIRLVTFGSDKSKTIRTAATSLTLELKGGRTLTITANIVPKITGNIERKPISLCENEDFKILTQNLSLADTLPTKKETGTIELLIGNDYYLDIIGSHKIQVLPGLYLLSSKLGWILTGRTNEINNEQDDMSMFIMTHGNSIDGNEVLSSIDESMKTKPDLEDFWNIETIGIKDNPKQQDDQRAMKIFKETLTFQDNRYSVTWPWKSEDIELPTNRQLALGRLKSLIHKLSDKSDLMKQYDSVIQDQFKKGIVEKVDANKSDGIRHYLPHHAVIKPDRATTKLRIVYDASAKTKETNKSLNECLYRGPVLLHDLCGTLIRFRQHEVGMVADIEKAFLQISLQTSQRDVTRFLWLKDIENTSADSVNIQEYRFCRVPFGVISSPFLLGATIDYHLDSYNSDIAKQLKDDIYMDNLITGASSVNDAKELYKVAKDIFAEANMNIREWTSNIEQVNNTIPSDDRADDEKTKVLGLRWNPKRDTLGIKPIKCQKDSAIFTKRSVLKIIASIFDPLGLFCPVTLRGKILLQTLWTKHVPWDEELSNDDSVKWKRIQEDVLNISNHEIPRVVCVSGTKENTTSQLVCFCDASKTAYAAVVYLLQGNKNNRRSEILFAKTRLAPIKEMTIPRLELLATLIGVRIVKYVESQIGIQIDQRRVLTDSLCVLNWIESEKQLPVFIKNRVSEIKKHTDISFHHVDSKENPADIASRGCTTSVLISSNQWWHGPKWLSENENIWPIVDQKSFVGDIEEASPVNQQITENVTLSQDTQDEIRSPFGMDTERYPSASKIVRVTATALRFISRLKREEFNNKYLTNKELETAEKIWIKYIQRKNFGDVFAAIADNKKNNLVNQLGVYLDDNGILRCRGRLENSCLNVSARRPILLPTKDRLTQLLVERVHNQLLHSGTSHTLSQVRNKYWIPRGRATVRKIIHECRVCKRHEGGPYKMPCMPPLPKKRVTESTAFDYTGLDYLGPVSIKTTESVKKVWICLFTCLVTRAVHLEIIQDMSAAQFLMCLRRFIAQRGTPSEIISDNALQFKVASETVNLLWQRAIHCEDVQTYASENGIKWTFIVEFAPWMGGYYERLVGIVKRSLRKALGRSLLSEIQLLTLLKEVEAVANSRPLVYVDDDIESTIVLTPSSFLTLNPRTGIPDTEIDADKMYLPKTSTAETLLKSWKKGLKLLDSFWKIWRNEYLQSLRERTQTSIKCGRVQSRLTPNVGDVVLIKDDLPRGTWRYGLITQLQQSQDGQFRSAKVKTSSGRIIGRPLNLLIPLEVSGQGKTNQQMNKDNFDGHEVVRPKRLAAEKAMERLKALV